MTNMRSVKCTENMPYIVKQRVMHDQLNWYLLKWSIKCQTSRGGVMVLFQLYCGGQFYWWRKPLTCRKSLRNFIT